MKKKKVWRYYCDFCGKGGCSGGAMAKHEKRCTMNPNRECGFHMDPLNIIEETQIELDELRKLIREAVLDSQEADTELVAALLDAAYGCPACVLAAIRQENATRDEGHQIHLTAFHYKEETERIFGEARERWNEEAQRDAMYC